MIHRDFRRNFKRLPQPIRRFAMLLLAGLTVCGAGSAASNSAHAQKSGPAASTPLDARPAEVQFGSAGQIRIGRWNPMLIRWPQGPVLNRFEIRTIDGDDEAVIYSGDLAIDPDRPGQYHAWFRIGKSVSSLSLILISDSGEHPKRILAIDRNTLLESVRPIIYTIEPETQIKSALDATLNARTRSGSPVVVAVQSAAGLPIDRLGYDSVDTIVMATGPESPAGQLTPMQRNAISDWVDHGGNLILSGSAATPNPLAADQPLAGFCPGEYDGQGEFTNSSRLESYADSRDQLIPIRGEPLSICLLGTVDGSVVVSDGRDHSLIVTQARGMGRITLVAFDILSDRLRSWGSYNSLLRKLVSGDKLERQEQTQKQASRGNSVSHYGYTDLAGQLRVPLDQFTQVQFVAFTWIAILIGLYILCIGPVDYFLLSKVLGKMELTWITFPLFSLLFCGLAMGISYWTRPDTIQMNQLEIIDMDAVSGRSRGTVWTTVYSPRGQSVDVTLDRNHAFGFALDETLVSWQGLPGDGLGGMVTRSNPAISRRGYGQSLAAADGVQGNLVQLPLQVSSSKALFSQWSAPNPVDVRSRPRSRNGRLTGAIKNPLDVELRNCRVFYDNWAYLLDQPLGPGETFDILTGTNEKTLKGVLTRRTKLSENENRSLTSPWDPNETGISRIADLLMFYNAAGGEGYTGLSHGYQSFVDLSGHLELGRAVLVGEIDRRGASLELNEGKLPAQYDQTTTIIRIIFPVATEPERNR